MKKHWKKIVVVFVLLLLFVFVTDSRLKIVKYTVKSHKITDEVKLALVTDLHNCRYGKNQTQLLNEIEKKNPDAVLLVGDIFDDDYINGNGEILAKSLSEKYKTYYVSGNHEWWGGDMYDIFDYLHDVGITVLRGDSDILEVGDSKVSISGIDDPAVNVYDEGYSDFDSQLAAVGEGADSEYFNILLSHRPDKEEMYFEYGFDLVLSGHAHGGQVRIPYLLNGLYAPNQGLFPKLAGGFYEFENGDMIVSRGLSRENTIVPRVFNRPELVFISINGE